MAIIYGRAESEKELLNQSPNSVKKIEDMYFVMAVQEMIRFGVIVPPKPEYELENIDIIKIPKWVKTIADWWAEGLCLMRILEMQ